MWHWSHELLKLYERQEFKCGTWKFNLELSLIFTASLVLCFLPIVQSWRGHSRATLLSISAEIRVFGGWNHRNFTSIEVPKTASFWPPLYEPTSLYGQVADIKDEKVVALRLFDKLVPLQCITFSDDTQPYLTVRNAWVVRSRDVAKPNDIMYAIWTDRFGYYPVTFRCSEYRLHLRMLYHLINCAPVLRLVIMQGPEHGGQNHNRTAYEIWRPHWPIRSGDQYVPW
jgi:hypothetical protein